jgi:hypothetical protein
MRTQSQRIFSRISDLGESGSAARSKPFIEGGIDRYYP